MPEQNVQIGGRRNIVLIVRRLTAELAQVRQLATEHLSPRDRALFEAQVGQMERLLHEAQEWLVETLDWM